VRHLLAFGREHVDLRSRFPHLTILGGCCGIGVVGDTRGQRHLEWGSTPPVSMPDL
jgi:hypothetical protein